MNTAMSTRPMPKPTAWSQPFWDAASEDRLSLQHCEDCELFIMYPKKYCPICLGQNLTWRDSAGLGEVYTYTEQMIAAPTGFEDQTPYVIAVIRLDEGVQMMSNIVGDHRSEVACGSRVRVSFQTVEGQRMPMFEVVPS